MKRRPPAQNRSVMPTLEPTDYLQFCFLLDDLEPIVKDLRTNEQEFIRDQIERNKKYGDQTLVSEKQMNWLKSLHDRYIGTGSDP